MPAQEWWVVKWKVGCEKILDGARLYAHYKFSWFKIQVSLSLIMLTYWKLQTVWTGKEFGLGFMVYLQKLPTSCEFFLPYKTCSCLFTIFLYIILGWYHNNLEWKYCLLFKLRKKNRVWTNKKCVYSIFTHKLLWYHPKIKYKNIIQKDMNKFEIQVIKDSKWFKIAIKS